VKVKAVPDKMQISRESKFDFPPSIVEFC